MNRRMTGKSRLGRGLDSLISVSAPAAAPGEPRRDYFLCDPARIEALEGQPRKHFDEERIEDLAESIRTSGIIQPLVVRHLGDGRFGLIAGERRLRAARLVGLEEVPVVVRDVSDTEAFTLALIENVQRQDLNPIEEAEAYRHLIDEYGLTHEEVAARVGCSRVTVTNSLRLMNLAPPVQQRVIDGELTAGHARAILTADPRWHEWIADQVRGDQLSVRRTEALARQAALPDFAPDRSSSAPVAPPLPAPGAGSAEPIDDRSRYTANVRDAERRLRERLGHKVSIRQQADGGGVIEIHAPDRDALIDIVDTILNGD